jgi:excisionase family DNA binding protein
MPTATLNRLYSKKETAKILNISIPTLDRRISDGSIEYFKQGWLIHFDESQIEAYKSKCRNAPRSRKKEFMDLK